MPNWCYNTVRFIGEPKDIEKIEDLLRSDGWEFNLNACIPYPEDYRLMDEEHSKFGFSSDLSQEEKDKLREAYVEKWGVDKDGFNHGGYEWCCNFWGTKWNISDAYWQQVAPHEITASFESAWAPPTSALALLAQDHPELRIRLNYEEPGMAFRGTLIWDEGSLVHEEHEDGWIPEESDEDWADRMFKEVEFTQSAVRAFDESDDGQRWREIIGETMWENLGGDNVDWNMFKS